MSAPPTTGMRAGAALIPAHNEEARIAGVVRESISQVREVWVVDDGSSDATAEAAEAAGARVIQHNRNQGKGAALRTGLQHLYGRKEIGRVVILDGDGQHDPAEIARFMELAGDYPLVVGNRMRNTTAMPPVRRAVNRLMSRWISKACGQPLPDTQCGFRMVERELIPLLLEGQCSRYDFETEMLLLTAGAGHQIGFVPVSTLYPEKGRSGIRPLVDTWRFWQLMRRHRKNLRQVSPMKRMAPVR